jgi:hypothetical protein
MYNILIKFIVYVQLFHEKFIFILVESVNNKYLAWIWFAKKKKKNQFGISRIVLKSEFKHMLILKMWKDS